MPDHDEQGGIEHRGDVATTLVFLTGLFAWEPFDRLSDGLDRVFGAPPAWTQVADMYRDPDTQEVSRGERVDQSFRVLAAWWAAHPGATRVVLMGNSQALMTSLAPGEAPSSGPEKTYPDLISDHYREARSQTLFYRLSAGGMSYQEMLWYAMYLVLRPEIKPDVLLVQLNYQNFANSGIRGGAQRLLSDPRLRSAVAAAVWSNRPYADSFGGALRSLDEEQASRDLAAASAGETVGYHIETSFFAALDRIPGVDDRERARKNPSRCF